jgi:predicted nucleic acid-binding protein
MVRGHAGVAKIVREADEIYISLVTLAELEYGFQCGSRTSENQMLLLRFVNSKKVKTLIPDHYSVSEFARIGKEMKQCGRILAHHDLWLAAQAVQNNIYLVTFDRDFTHVKNAGIKGFHLFYLTED